ncbi:AMIN-like domain-containing (lipo)protein [Corynebacterium nasicanis]|uniref:AMIN-like domain-containing protein n=1 Tax=Corynebacterium nasicanis TaxID=1448267 RepID=A0ABW1Q7U4_9CORY
MTTYRRPLVPAVLSVAALLLTACNGAGGADAPATTTATSAAPLTVTSTAAPAQETTTTSPAPVVSSLFKEPVWVEPAPLLTGVRVGEHDTFDRVVYDFVGNGEPGWYTEYLDQPYQQGSGHDVEVAGEAFLKIDLTGTTYPFEHEAEGLAVGPHPGGGVVQQVVNTGTFEGHTLTYIGLDKQRPYSVTVLQDPLRVVVDIQK